ncbi:type II toxin-antitoxin system HipA family toxin YjjJ [Aeromonas salmonicida]|uniref:type II toxin-antitoxin system HipA family toxin YjjJ n=1 Tax=Aeromonas salmonicida TaxID=645 RepID=UPI001F38BB39|nr:type II toxin-antitoxin system HipA family toxin YjjJ [Aeromonas salmonicida]MCE9932690.1 type II toxin-antitoxin system HipA family toxin YjjJ [Aeromonas salmonicida]
MQDRRTTLSRYLSSHVARPRELIDIIGVSQSTLYRDLLSFGDRLVTFGSGRSIHYALRDTKIGIPDVPVYRAGAAGESAPLGMLIPVLPEGFVWKGSRGEERYFESLPWWLLDMRPQGYLGRAYASAFAEELHLSNNPEEWSDAEIIGAFLAHGNDPVGNLLIGEASLRSFLDMPAPVPVDRAVGFPLLAQAAAQGEIPGSSAGGEQPKFCTYTDKGHVIVKFTIAADNPISERWADLLLTEHIALGVLGVSTYVHDFGGQRFLEIPRFDRVGERGRIGMFSIRALDAEFVGARPQVRWPSLVKRLFEEGCVTESAVKGTSLLWAFGRLIGNTDMHNGNLSFIAQDGKGRPYHLAPAYDMLPMAFSPKTSGEISNQMPLALITDEVGIDVWADAWLLAQKFLNLSVGDERFSPNIRECFTTIQNHLAVTRESINFSLRKADLPTLPSPLDTVAQLAAETTKIKIE